MDLKIKRSTVVQRPLTGRLGTGYILLVFYGQKTNVLLWGFFVRRSFTGPLWVKAFYRFSMAQEPSTGLDWHVDLLLVFYYPMIFFYDPKASHRPSKVYPSFTGSLQPKNSLKVFHRLKSTYRSSTIQRTFTSLLWPDTSQRSPEDLLWVFYCPKNCCRTFWTQGFYWPKTLHRPPMGRVFYRLLWTYNHYPHYADKLDTLFTLLG